MCLLTNMGILHRVAADKDLSGEALKDLRLKAGDLPPSTEGS